MESDGLLLETADALALFGIDRKAWENMVTRQLYTAAPPVKPGFPRFFDRDDVVALFVLDHFNRLGVGLAMAARVASAVRVELRKGGEDLRSLWVLSTASGRPRRVVSREPPDDLIRHEIPVRQLRLEIERLVTQQWEKRSQEKSEQREREGRRG